MSTMSSMLMASSSRFMNYSADSSTDGIDTVFDRKEAKYCQSRMDPVISSRGQASGVQAEKRNQGSSLRYRGRRGSFTYDRCQRVRTQRPVAGESDSSSRAIDHERYGLGSSVKATQWEQITILLLLTVVMGILAFTIVQLTGDPTASLPTNLASVSVQSGDTLGSIALHYAPHADAGAVIARIQELNGLTSSAISPGQVLVVPAGL